MTNLRADRKNKWIASRAWYLTAITLILWATLQEIVLESTDLVDNFFANAIQNNVDGYRTFHDQLRQVFNDKVIYDSHLMDSWGLGNFIGYNYTAGQLAMNGVTASNQIYFIMFAVISGSCYGMGIYNAQYFGGGRYNELRQVTMLKIYVTLVITIIVLILGQTIGWQMIAFTTSPKYAPLPDPNFNPLTAGSDKATAQAWFNYFEYRASTLSTEEGLKYFHIITISYPLLAINTSFITTLRETNRPVKALWLSLIALATNCIGNPLLIEPHFFGSFTGLGVEGSAIATSCSRVFQLIFLVILFGIKRYEFIPVNIFKFNKIVVQKAFLKAWPIIFNELLWSIGMVVQVKLRGERGVDALTANAIFSTITSSIYSPLYHGLSAGTSILVGNRLGANKLDEAEFNARQLLIIALGIGIVFGWVLAAIAFFFPDQVFTNSTSETLRISHWMLFIYGLMYPLLIFTSTSYAIIRTGGAVFNAFLLDAVYTWVVPVPLLAGLIFGTHLDIAIIVVIAQVTDSLKAIWAFMIFRRKKWLRNLTIFNTPNTETLQSTPLESLNKDTVIIDEAMSAQTEIKNDVKNSPSKNN